ncbi:hypothetical protein BGZ83_002021 [Gryganskiella cystojenkinii]|nr:hypothetical protein BGZ83_002021 [Gryganskiella cystojenkinii]
MATSIWESPALAKFKATMEKMILPATYNALVTIKTYVVVTFFSLYAWTHRVAEPVTTAVMWFVVHCIIQPARAIWSRLEVLGITFLQTAKIYLSELVKDAVDLFWFFVKTGKWIYERTLQPLGRVICKAFSILLEKLLLIIPWLAKKSYTGILRPMATTVRSGYTILRSHPTLLAGLQALSIKIQECVMLAMQRLEGVNWLLLIEKVLTNVVVTTYQVLSQILTKVSRGLQILFVDLIPNAYSDLMSALEFAKPIVAWVIDKVVKILHPLWHIVSWISWTVFTNMRPTLAWLQQKIVLPSVNFWNSTLYPVLSTVDAVIMNNIKLVSSSLLRVISWISVVAGPIWVGFVQVLTILQSSLESALVKIGILSGGLGERIQKQIQIMAPQVESFKTQVGVMVDEFVLAANNFMINWAKQEKRD